MKISNNKSFSLRLFWRRGNLWIWLSASAVSLVLLLLLLFIGYVSALGLSSFWPKPILEFTYNPLCESPERQNLSGRYFGIAGSTEHFNEPSPQAPNRGTGLSRTLFQVNQETGPDAFFWLCGEGVQDPRSSPDLVLIDREDGGFTLARLKRLQAQGVEFAEAPPSSTLQSVSRWQKGLSRIQSRISGLKSRFRTLNRENEHLKFNPDPKALQTLKQDIDAALSERANLQSDLSTYKLTLETPAGLPFELSGRQVHTLSLPNVLNFPQKLGLFFHNFYRFLSEPPRNANTQGGLFPAIFGTILMVLIMTLVVTPLGVTTAIYLHEYGRKNPLSNFIRIMVHNLSGVPSIVYGIFSLGFFVYFLGGHIDHLFFPEKSPQPVFGTGGILWASLTLAILTIPVMVVTTEEGLSSIPKNQREGSLALGATRFETLVKIILPMCTPAILTGVILAIARAAGEVAPLMLVGVVKLAPSLPVDSFAPFLHLNQKFMHLGFYIYDNALQSPDIEVSKPLVYSASLVLLLTVLCLNLAAIALRNRLQERYKALED